MTARIVLAEGIAATRITLKVRLAAACYDVVAVSSAAEVFGQFHDAPPEIIVIGGGLPDMEAVDLCRQITRDQISAEIPVIMLVDIDHRLAALQAGATATLEPDVDDQMLMARIRNILRDSDLPEKQAGMAEQAAGFTHAASPLIALVADNPGRAQRWRQMLSGRMSCRFEIRDADEALAAATKGRTADLYVISADIRGRGDGLRLLSELRSRQGSRDAGFVIAIAPDRAELSAIALDLGAGEVIPETLGSEAAAQAAAMSLKVLLSRKSRSDQRRAEMRQQMLWAMTDPLTGLHNRRYALPRLRDIAQRAAGDRRAFAVFAIDLDHFKTVNDSHGHTAGDEVLAETAQRLQDCIGGAGILARMGGEEFMAVIDDCPPDAARHLAERLRRCVQARQVALPALSGGGAIRVTASVGVACILPGEDIWPDHLARIAVERADRALLAAKSAGRNCVVADCPDRAA